MLKSPGTLIRALIGLLLLIGSSATTPAQALLLLPGETLRVRFDQPAPPNLDIPGLPASSPFNIANTLYGILNVSGTINAISARFELFDGTASLGSYELINFAMPFTSFAFSGPGSNFTFRAGMIPDLSALEDGTIDGRIEITNISPRAYDFNVSGLSASHGFSSNARFELSPAPVITFQGSPFLDPTPVGGTDPGDPVAVPEPPGLPLFAIGLLGLLSLRSRRIRRSAADWLLPGQSRGRASSALVASSPI